MPGRKIPLVTEQYYHVFNRGVAGQPTFTDMRSYKRSVEILSYYQNRAILPRYSHFIKLSRSLRTEMLEEVRSQLDFYVEIIAYCLMPNHFHLLLRQTVDNGISKFMADFSNSYTRYFNTKNDRFGPVFQGKFKAVLVETEQQLIHLSRYIHLNPYTSYLIKTLSQLADYQFSSLPSYISNRHSDLVDRELILSHFKTSEKYSKFVFDNADYQRKLRMIKHLILEK